MATSELKLSDFDFALPDDLIAAYPAARREESRLLVVDRRAGAWSHHRFADLPHFLQPADLLVLNDTRVIPARVFGAKRSGGRVEILFAAPLPEEAGRWQAMVRGKMLAPGDEIRVGSYAVRLLERRGAGWAVAADVDIGELLREAGEMPLPPYILQRRKLLGEGRRWVDDGTRYQTVYAREEGAVAAPTAGLHFTPEMLARLAADGVHHAAVTLHVGLGTFLPMRTENIDEHVMHEEAVHIDSKTADRLEAHKGQGGRIVAVGTTVVRTLEGVCRQQGRLTGYRGPVNLFIKPGFPFRCVDRLVTNFHLPKSTLLLLVAALGGRELILEAYRDAVKERYRFYSYGDAMLIL